MMPTSSCATCSTHTWSDFRPHSCTGTFTWARVTFVENNNRKMTNNREGMPEYSTFSLARETAMDMDRRPRHSAEISAATSPAQAGIKPHDGQKTCALHLILII